MTTAEMSDAFDTLANAYYMREGFGDDPRGAAFDEYEKSLFLTKAQKDVVLSYYTGKTPIGEGFEHTEEVRRYLANLVKEASLTPLEGTEESPLPAGISQDSTFFLLPEDLWFITYEAAQAHTQDCRNGTMLDVVPVTQDEYHKVKRNPFRGANGRRVLRLDLAGNMVELVSPAGISLYYLRYLAALSPIILTDLPDGMTIDHISEATACKLHEALHEEILERGVMAAIASRHIQESPQQEK